MKAGGNSLQQVEECEILNFLATNLDKGGNYELHSFVFAYYYILDLFWNSKSNYKKYLKNKK